MKILLMGNPNVGKSVIFSRLTGAHVISSNYPGTTVGYTRGNIWLDGERHEIIDVPGTYTLKPSCRAEEVAVEMLEEGDIIINVVDATTLERSLYLTTQLMEIGKPMIIALNMWDDVRHKGININLEKLRNALRCPILPTVAVTGEGIKYLVDALSHIQDVTSSPLTGNNLTDEERWKQIGHIINEVQHISHRHHTFLEKFEDATIKPITGIPFAIFTLGVSFIFIRFLGEATINYLLDPLFKNYYVPYIIKLITLYFPSGVIHTLLIGESQKVMESLGLLTTGIYLPMVMVLPYVFSFYLVLSFMEDLGYLPRLAILMDTVMHKIGLHGFAVISLILGLGCKVPGVLSTRILETRREKFIAGTLISISMPCMSQTAMIIGLISPYGIQFIFLVYGILFVLGIAVGILLDHLLTGGSPEIFIEIPSYHIPHLGTLLKKLWMRIHGFINEAIPFVLIGILIINILNYLGFLQFLERLFSPVLCHLLGLPNEVVSAMIVGLLRKDIAMGLLKPLHLTVKQLIVACTVLTIYFPCLATFFVLFKELGLKDMLKAALIMIASALSVGFLLHLVL